jgi:hypothetical protein
MVRLGLVLDPRRQRRSELGPIGHRRNHSACEVSETTPEHIGDSVYRQRTFRPSGQSGIANTAFYLFTTSCKASQIRAAVVSQPVSCERHPTEVGIRYLAPMMFCVCFAAAGSRSDPLAIVRKAVDLSLQNEALTHEYSMVQQSVKRDLRSDGSVASTETETFEVHPVGGEPVQKLIQRNGKPLSESEAREQEDKFNRIVGERKNETPQQRSRRLKRREEKWNQRREMLRELPDAFVFQIMDEEVLDGHDAWRIRATPRPGYEPRSARSAILTKMEGQFWISKKHNRLIKVDAVTTDNVSFGWFLARVGPGTRITFEQMKLPHDVWVLRRFKMAYNVRIAFVKHARGETEQIMWNFNRASDLTTD